MPSASSPFLFPTNYLCNLNGRHACKGAWSMHHHPHSLIGKWHNCNSRKISTYNNNPQKDKELLMPPLTYQLLFLYCLEIYNLLKEAMQLYQLITPYSLYQLLHPKQSVPVNIELSSIRRMQPPIVIGYARRQDHIYLIRKLIRINILPSILKR